MAVLDKAIPDIAGILDHIERDHEIFMRLLTDLADQLADPKGREKKARAIFEKLERQVREHLRVELHCMGVLGYGERTNHQLHLEEFEARMQVIHRRLAAQGALHDQMGDLVDWLLTHIHKVDNRFLSFLRMRMLQTVLREINLRATG